MGIRLQKVLGYGFTLNPDDDKKKYQEQVDNFSEKVEVTGNYSKNAAIKSYANFLENKHKETVKNNRIDWYLLKNKNWKHLPGRDRKITVSNIFHQTTAFMFEDGDKVKKNVFLVVPPVQVGGWVRCDNTIDFMEHFEKYNQPQNIATVFSKGLYPYNDYIMNKTTGELIPKYDFSVVHSIYQQNQQHISEELNNLCVTMVGIPAEELFTNYTLASVPYSIQDTLEWAGFSKEDLPRTRFQPMLLEYWV